MLIRLYGDGACWTIPQLRSEPHTYDVPTPSGIQGALESVYWKPEMQWVIQTIFVLAPIKRATMRVNHVEKPAAKTGQDVTEARTQRRITYLRDVDYLIEARVAGDDPGKHLNIAQRRLERGQWYRRPYLGMAEFPAHV